MFTLLQSRRAQREPPLLRNPSLIPCTRKPRYKECDDPSNSHSNSHSDDELLLPGFLLVVSCLLNHVFFPRVDDHERLAQIVRLAFAWIEGLRVVEAEDVAPKCGVGRLLGGNVEVGVGKEGEQRLEVPGVGAATYVWQSCEQCSARMMVGAYFECGQRRIAQVLWGDSRETGLSHSLGLALPMSISFCSSEMLHIRTLCPGGFEH